jgi:hypothetical protein
MDDPARSWFRCGADVGRALIDSMVLLGSIKTRQRACRKNGRSVQLTALIFGMIGTSEGLVPWVMTRQYPLLRDDLPRLTLDRLAPVVLIKANVCRILKPKLVQRDSMCSMAIRWFRSLALADRGNFTMNSVRS